jgi:arginase family enzyme
MSIYPYLSPINPDELGYRPSEYAITIGDHVHAYLPDTNPPEIPKDGLVLLGVEEDRGADQNAGCGTAPNEIRHYLYQLARPTDDTVITDLGNIVVGQTTDDTYYAVAEVVAEVIGNGNTLILLGGSQDLTFATYKGYERLNRVINITTIDSRFDLEAGDEITSRTWLRNIVMQEPNYLFFHANIGYQTYFVGNNYVQLFDDLKFDACRLGEVKQNMVRAEALIRNADLLSVDLGAVRQSDAPAHGTPSPHGLYGEDLCQMLRYAGLTDKTRCLGIFEANPFYDNHGQTMHMVAQALWYFIEGFYGRKHDSPLHYPEQCRHFLITCENIGIDIDFYKSNHSDRWWMRVPCDNPKLQEIYSDHLMLPCTYEDYQQCMAGDVPELWWRYFKRLNG